MSMMAYSTSSASWSYPWKAPPILGGTVCAGTCRIQNGCGIQVYGQSYEEEGVPERGCEESWVHLLQVL
jgi:hypothetical protein